MVKVLFLDDDNSSLSQIGAAYLHRIGNKIFEVKSAGIHAGNLNAYMLDMMLEKRFPVTQLFTKPIQYFLRKEENFQYIISFLPEHKAEQVTLFPAAETIMYWNIKDLRGFEGNEQEIISHTRKIFDAVRHEVRAFIRMHMDKMSKAEAVFQL